MAKINQAMEDLLRYNAAILPQKRSTFDKSHSHTTTGDSSYIIPLMWDRVLPGDEKKIRYSGLARMATPIHPVMDEAKFDVACFFVPDRLTWEHARQFYGENLDASFNPDGDYVMPSIPYSKYATDYNSGMHSLNDYFGLPLYDRERPGDTTSTAMYALDKPEYNCNALLWRGYQLIYNYFYRNSSVQPALQLSTGDDVTSNEWNVIKEIRRACKFPDYFTSLLREPQAGDDVLLPLGDKAPVVTGDKHASGSVAMSFNRVDVNTRGLYVSGRKLFSGDPKVNVEDAAGNVLNSDFEYAAPNQNPIPDNLWADLTSATAATINNLRAAITVQQLLEVDAMAGKRYQQIMQAHFGVFTPDATLQQPELLGLTRTSVGMRQVIQTSSTDNTSPQGNTAAFSLTNVSNEWICNKSFTEPGFIYVLGVIRPVHSYSQGVDPLLRKLNRYDHYWPVFDNLGNQPVDNASIYLTNTGNDGMVVLGNNGSRTFGFAEAWTEYRIRQNRVSGLMRPDAKGSLATWNYSEDLGSIPVLNGDFVSEDPDLIDRTIAVPSEPQFIIDSYFDYKDTKNMSVHSVPGLLRL